MSVSFSFIVQDNEKSAQKTFDQGDYVLSILLIHSLIESILRVFFSIDDKKRFSELIKIYSDFLEKEIPGSTTFVEELTQFNRRRNRIVHQLWQKGYTFTNKRAKNAAYGAIFLYGLFIEFLQTFDSDLERKGFSLTEDP